MNRVKEHIRKHKELYIGVGIGCVLAGITCIIVRDNLSGKDRIIGHTGSGKDRIIGHTGSRFSAGRDLHVDASINKTVKVLEREGRGHPGYLVKHIETGLVYASQRAAAEALDISKDALSNHLNGRTEHVLGNHFERLIMAPVDKLVS